MVGNFNIVFGYWNCFRELIERVLCVRIVLILYKVVFNFCEMFVEEYFIVMDKNENMYYLIYMIY